MTLDEMTSSDDFHLISVSSQTCLVELCDLKLTQCISSQLKNFLGLAGIVVAVLIPVVRCVPFLAWTGLSG